MSLNTPPVGLRRIHHNAISASKVQISVPADDTLIVSDEVAEQLLRTSEFQEVARAEPKPAEPVKAAAKKSAAKSKS